MVCSSSWYIKDAPLVVSIFYYGFIIINSHILRYLVCEQNFVNMDIETSFYEVQLDVSINSFKHSDPYFANNDPRV